MPQVYLNLQEIAHPRHAFMAAHAQKPLARTNVTKIEYDLFVKECQRVARAPNGPTLDHFNGRDRKLTLNGTLNGET